MIACFEPCAGAAAQDILARADAARDAQGWADAAAAYAAYLALRPDDAAIWVQAGHAAKEAGDQQAAIAAYARAATLDPASSDALVHLGHLHLRLGDPVRGRDALAAAWAREPMLETWDALCASGGLDAAALLAFDDVPEIAAALVCDLSDLIDYVAAHAAQSGIQRVQTGLATALRQTGGDVAFAFVREGCGHVWQIADAALDALIANFDCAPRDPVAIGAALDRLRRTARAARPAPGSAWCILGAFWGRDNAAAHRAALRRKGVRVGALIHDLFPITHPQYAGPGVVERFAPHLRQGLAEWDFVLANSPSTARALQAWIAAETIAAPAVAVVPLAHGMGKAALQQRPDPALHSPDHVLCVGTIEPRKNHAGLIAAWRALASRGLALPRLVLAGRIGWQADAVLAALAEAQAAGLDIVHVESPGDADLHSLYARAAFTVLPSHGEGWGLPFGEALAHGKTCVIAQGSAMAEAGAEWAVLFDPDEPHGLADAIGRLIAAPELRIAIEARIAQGFTARGWDHVALDLRAAIAAAPLRALPHGAAPVPLLRHGRIDAGGRLIAPHALLALGQAAPPGSAVKLALNLTCSDGGAAIRLATPLAEACATVAPHRALLVPILSLVDADGTAPLALRTEGAPVRANLAAIAHTVPMLEAHAVLDFVPGADALPDAALRALHTGLALDPTCGAVMIAPHARIVFRAGVAAGLPCRVMLATAAGGCPAVAMNGGPVAVPAPGAQAVALDGLTGEGGLVTLDLTAADPRRIALLRLCHGDPGDPASRLALVEAMLLAPAPHGAAPRDAVDPAFCPDPVARVAHWLDCAAGARC